MCTGLVLQTWLYPVKALHFMGHVCFGSFDRSTACHLFSSYYFHGAFLYRARKRALFKSVPATHTVQYALSPLSIEGSFRTTKKEEGMKEIKRKQIHALVFLRLSSAVLRTERDKVGEGEMKLRGENAEKSGENNGDRKHFALDFVRRSQSFPSILASCPAHFSSTESRRLSAERTHKHTPKQTLIHMSCP